MSAKPSESQSPAADAQDAGVMEVLQHFIANLYLSAPQLDANEYRDWALGEVQHMVHFDGALWGTGTALSGTFHSLTLRGLPPSFPADLLKTREDNPLYAALQEENGRPINMFDVIEPDAFRKSKVYKRCFRKHKIEHILSTRNVNARSGLSSLITLYRSDRDDPFTEEDREIQAIIAYHLGKAASHAFFLHLTRPEQQRADQRGSAVVDRHGVFHEVDNTFLDLIDAHVPDHEHGMLPFPLPNDECSMEFQGLYVQASRFADLILVRIRESGPLDQLTRRERQVVEGVCRGLSHKEIGRELGLAPTTVSSHLYRAYEKLGVASKTALSRLIRGTSVLQGRKEDRD